MKIEWNCRDPEVGGGIALQEHGFTITLLHHDDEPEGVNRIRISTGANEVELLPSKGLSVGDLRWEGIPVLWEAPIALPDPDSLDFTGSHILIHGKPAPEFEYIRTFAGGIEMLGLRNWGMPRRDPKTGEILPLHGEVSNIPVDRVVFDISGSVLRARGTFIYRYPGNDPGRHWYESGGELFEVTRELEIDSKGTRVWLHDVITNVTGEPQQPDWGYHVTFRPENGSRILIPSRRAEMRGGGDPSAEDGIWRPARDEKKREERGVIHKQLKTTRVNGMNVSKLLKVYPDGRSFELTIPEAPYFQTWDSRGGAGGDEFTYRDGSPVFRKNWDGLGVEFGSSPLDHDGNTDPSVTGKRNLEPGESLRTGISVRPSGPGERDSLIREIEEYRSARTSD